MPEREKASTQSRLSSGVSRRSFLGTTGVAAASLSVSGTASAASSCTRQETELNSDVKAPEKASTTEVQLETEQPDSESVPEIEYDRVINVVEAGADNTGGESIAPVISNLVADNTLLKFPEGRYYMDELVRFTGFENFGMVGEDATIVPAPADEYMTEARMFKLGVNYSPGRNVHIAGFTIDYTAPNTGLRAFDLTVTDGLVVENITFDGIHTAGTWGPMHVDIVNSGGYGVVKNIDMGEGGEFTANTPQDAMPAVDTGPTAFLLSPYHSGRLDVKDCVIDAWPDNGLYDSESPGQVVVTGGTYKNCNSASIRLTGDGSGVYGATVAVDQNRAHDEGQRGIRFDGGSDLTVVDTEITLEKPNGEAIAFLPPVDSATIKNTTITVQESAVRENIDAFSIAEGVGQVSIEGGSITQNYHGQALQILSGDKPVIVDGLDIHGNASGDSGGRNAIYCERDGCEFHDLVVDQPGGDHRRALGIFADDVLVEGGEYAATGRPITINGAGIRIQNVTAGSYGSDTVAVEVIDGGAKIVDSLLHGGYTGTNILTSGLTTGN
ncbi:right-handed parallel beta-helix repeat-containing protein [Halocatena marina]|uniref:right-handed parallel beta-helix repeat-containing protein n=1 Tax=Halocatena marina TaxID=2934937 RepID=UPI00200FD69F|nr:right-handed parallel beta-helix repeat-containing protein [Halocatena marina]